MENKLGSAFIRLLFGIYDIESDENNDFKYINPSFGKIYAPYKRQSNGNPIIHFIIN